MNNRKNFSFFKVFFIISAIVLTLSCNNTDENASNTNQSDSLEEARKHLPENALKGLEVAQGLVVKPMATEPVIRNPTNIDVDERGRVWVTEAYNYRPEINGNPVTEKGDRIMILEDKDGDGVTEHSKVFYQGPEINAPLGVCILGNKVLISQSPYVWAFYDDDGDDSADRKEIVFQGIGGEQHDHGMHTFTFGPDGKLYFNFGNEGNTLKDKNGKVVLDQDGDEIGPRKYRMGMVFRCDPDGSNVECLGSNFRNNYEVAVDSYGTMWQSDNDDDGNRSVRINYVMDYGNYGFQDEMTGASWQSNRTNIEDSIMFRHWHLNDPGVVPNLLQTGAGSPTGMVIYEGNLLPPSFRNGMIHADPGVNVVRAYPIKNNGAGYTASTINLLNGQNDQWFRPSDICVAPDGSLIVADWYDPGVGGHQAGDQQRGRIYRIAPEGSRYTIPKQDYGSPEGVVKALQSPNLAVRHHAWTVLQTMNTQAVPALEHLWRSVNNPRMRARAFWVLVKLPGGEKYIEEAINDPLAELRITGLRAARQSGHELVDVITKLSNDSDRQVLRECAIALRHLNDPQAPKLWAALAAKHNGDDRWYLEALGIGADRQWDAFFTEYLNVIDQPFQSAAGRDIIWRARTDKAIPYLAQLAEENAADIKSRLRYFRAFDFNTGPAKSQYLLKMLENNYGKDTALTKLILRHLDHSAVLNSAIAKKALDQAIQSVKGTPEYLEMVRQYEYKQARPALLEMVVGNNNNEEMSKQAAGLILKFRGNDEINRTLKGNDTTKAIKMMNALGNVGSMESLNLLQQVAFSKTSKSNIRQVAVNRMGSSMSGEDRVLELLSSGKMPEDLKVAAVEGMKGAWRKSIYLKARTYLPGALDATQQTAEPVAIELIALKANGTNGKTIFKNNCSICHQVKGEGQNFGPNLTEIGNKLPKEALLESIVHPSSGISFGYETSKIEMKDGSSYTGIISSKTETDLELKMPGGSSQRLKVSDVKKIEQLKESMMPAMHTTLNKQELADLLEYLASLKKG